MDRDKKLRRVVLVCSQFVRNLAYYRAGWKGDITKFHGDFWKTINGNFLDICILEWCKLFGDHKDKHHWKQVMKDHKLFKNEMFETLKINQSTLDGQWESIRSYRDQFVAHLDNEKTMKIPQLDLALKTVIFFHSKIVEECSMGNALQGLPTDLEVYYKSSWGEAELHYASIKT